MRGKKHRLLIFDYIHRQRRGLFLVAALVFAGLYALPLLLDEEAVSKLWPPEYDWLFLAGSIIAFLAFLYKLIAPRLAYVQCTNKSVRIQTPLVPLLISYKRIHTTRPNQWGRIYPPDKRNRRTRRLIERIGGGEVIVLDLKGWPAPMGWLRLWVPDVMFSPDSVGFVLWVKDWMTLSREIRDFQDRRRDALAGPREEASIYSRMKR